MADLDQSKLMKKKRSDAFVFQTFIFLSANLSAKICSKYLLINSEIFKSLPKKRAEVNYLSGLVWDLRVAHPEGVEPPTSWSVARHSIQLSYGCTTMYPTLIRKPSKLKGFMNINLLIKQL